METFHGVMVSAEGATSGRNIILVKALKVVYLTKSLSGKELNIVLASHKTYAN